LSGFLKQVLPKVIWEEHIATAHGREWTCLLHVLPTSCAIPTADKSNHSATSMLHPHGNATCIVYV